MLCLVIGAELLIAAYVAHLLTDPKFGFSGLNAIWGAIRAIPDTVAQVFGFNAAAGWFVAVWYGAQLLALALLAPSVRRR